MFVRKEVLITCLVFKFKWLKSLPKQGGLRWHLGKCRFGNWQVGKGQRRERRCINKMGLL